MFFNKQKTRPLYAALIGAISVTFPIPSNANETLQHKSSPYLLGSLGLNTVPSARTDETGTVRLGIATLDPYIHSYLGIQIADPLHITIRQTAEISNINESARRLYPGVDLKIRLTKETRSRPEISIGIASALGHKRMAGEYIAASKRYKDFDFTAGLGWGRFGTANHFDNPLKLLSNDHFGKNHSLDGEMPNAPSDWFTGKSIGLFGGLEYFTPIDGLSLKLDYGADRYEAEKTAFAFDTPAPWSAGLSYSPTSWFNAALGIQGTDKILGRLSLTSNVKKWKNNLPDEESHSFFRPFRTGLPLPAQMETSAESQNILLYNTTNSVHRAKTQMVLQPGISTPHQLGSAVIHMANHAGPAIEEFQITPTILALRGPSIKLMRRDLEQHYTHNQSSPQEIWRHSNFENTDAPFYEKLKRPRESAAHQKYFHFALDNHLGLSEEDHGTLARTSFLAEARGVRLLGLLDTGGSVRLNLYDNLSKLNDIRPRAFLPVRSNIDQFADTRVSLDTLYDAISHSFSPNLHTVATIGYLEEMYGGFGGEILYRPFGKRYAFGAEAWQVFKRDPKTFMNAGLNGDHLLTGHINGWYDIPNHDITVRASAGRYLAEDIGATLGLSKKFNNGAELETFITITDNADLDLFGGTTHAYQGLQLTLPLGGFKHIPQNAEIRTKIEPFGRDTGQRLQSPLPLYDITEQFSKSHLIRHWDQITD